MEQNVENRNDHLSWDQYFMCMAVLASTRSKDPNTKVGCVIVSEDNRIISTGYNGFPAISENMLDKNNDDVYPWDRDGERNKYDYVAHAELNAITAGVAPGNALKGAKIYNTLYPCNECAKLIIQSGINKVYYLSNKYADTKSVKVAKEMFLNAGVSTIQENLDDVDGLMVGIKNGSFQFLRQYSQCDGVSSFLKEI